MRVWCGHLLFFAFTLAYFWFSFTLWFSYLCGQNVLWLGPALALLLASSNQATCQQYTAYCYFFDWWLDGPCTWKNSQYQMWSPLAGHLTCSVWACLVKSVILQICLDDVLMLIFGRRRSKVNWGHSWDFLKLGQRPFDVWCHLQAFVCLSALLHCFRGCGWALAWTAVVLAVLIGA